MAHGLRRARSPRPARAGHAAEIAREGALLEPDAALAGPPIPNGDYRCRVIKLGAKSEGMLDYIAYPAFTCRIAPATAAAGLRQADRVAAPCRADLPRRRDAPGVPRHAWCSATRARACNMAATPTATSPAIVERIGPDRWRLVMPSPHFESLLDVMELSPECQ